MTEKTELQQAQGCEFNRRTLLRSRPRLLHPAKSQEQHLIAASGGLQILAASLALQLLIAGDRWARVVVVQADVKEGEEITAKEDGCLLCQLTCQQVARRQHG